MLFLDASNLEVFGVFLSVSYERIQMPQRHSPMLLRLTPCPSASGLKARSFLPFLPTANIIGAKRSPKDLDENLLHSRYGKKVGRSLSSGYSILLHDTLNTDSSYESLILLLLCHSKLSLFLPLYGPGHMQGPLTVPDKQRRRWNRPML